MIWRCCAKTLNTIKAASAGMPARVHYALKANPEARIVAEVAQRGFGAGMNNLICPASYQAVHRIDNLSAPNGTPTATYDIVGPVRETADTFAEGEEIL